ncbi:MAG: T9SS type A sorting domain-containing protein, partial [Bacteroidetes bacterium]|nr:T9SS type A sorting domain-containing protein [Bacteroidota bacterium]
PGRRSLYDTFRALIELKSDYAVFSTDNFSISQQQGKLKRINLQHSEMDVVVLGNFDVLTGTIPGGFTRTGKWYEFFSGDSLMITSSTLDSEISLQAGEYRLYTSTRIERPAFITSAESPLEGRRVSSVNAFPNPFRYGTMLTFGQVASGTGAEIEIVSLKGQPVRRLRAASGSSEIWWDGLTESGTEAEPGIYFIKMSDGIVMSTGRLIKF